MRNFILRLYAFIFGAEKYARKVGVALGRGCRVYSYYFGSEPFLVSIGDNVTITSGVRFVTHDGATGLVKDGEGRRFRFGKITVGNNVFIGVNTIILPGVSIGDRCIIGAGSVVARSIPPGSVAAGVPAKVLGAFEDYEARVLKDEVSENMVPRTNSLGYKDWVLKCLAKRDEVSRE